MDRWILHCDMNSYYASVELLSRPELADQPVAICGSPQDRRGIVLAKNEAAKACGIKTAETIWSAMKKCPGLLLLPPHYDRYELYSDRINQIYLRYSDRVEPFSIDESWLDVTGSLQHFGMSAVELADHIRHTVGEETGLTLSVGVSFNKVFAKMGSDYQKPDATTLIHRENYRDILWPLDVSQLFFVGKVTADKLRRMNLLTIGDLARADVALLTQALGKHGSQLHDYANGLDREPVCRFNERKEVKTVGNGITFRRNLVGEGDIRTAVRALSDRVGTRLREKKMRCGGVKVEIKDPDFRTISRQQQLQKPTDSGAVIEACALDLLERNWDYRSPIRLLAVTALSLILEGEEEQLTLALEGGVGGESDERLVEGTLDKIREKFGTKAIVYGGLLQNDLGISTGRRGEVEYEER